MRGCASELGQCLGPDYEVSGTFMPGSRLQNITNLARNEIAGFSKEDTVIIWGGSNDVNRNESTKGLMNLNEFVDQRNNTNIVIVTIPLRNDLSATSCINKEVQNFNKKLHKIMKNKDNVRILDHEPTREDFTQHGLHFNATSKTKVAKLMSQNISLLSENRKKASTVNNIPTVQNEEYMVVGNEGGNEDQVDSINQRIETSSLDNSILKDTNEEYMVVGNEGGNEDQVDSINQRIETSSLDNGILKDTKVEEVVIKNKERKEDQADFKNQGLRTSTRPKKSPNTRSDDFLWV